MTAVGGHVLLNKKPRHGVYSMQLRPAISRQCSFVETLDPDV